MSLGTLNVLVVVVLGAVAGLGLLIFRLQRRAQTVVPDVAERQARHGDRAVAVDAQGRDVRESQDVAPEPARDEAAFDRVLEERLHELHPEDPPGGERGARPQG